MATEMNSGVTFLSCWRISLTKYGCNVEQGVEQSPHEMGNLVLDTAMLSWVRLE